jgi:hypothetical protein
MLARDPREAVLEHLGARAAPREAHTVAPVLAGRTRPTSWHTRSGVPWTAQLDSVEFVKQREVLGCRLFVVAFEADHVRLGPVTMHMIVRAERDRGGWVARSVSGGAGGGEARPREPHVNLGGSWGRFGFCGGGEVHAARADIARVRLRFGNGVECEDDTAAGWVLFYTDRPVERPHATVELLDGAGEIVASYEWPPRRDLPQTLLRRIARS